MDPQVAAHFHSAARVIDERRRLMRWELRELADALGQLPFDIVLLKGAAYELQGLPLAGARFAGDIDFLVRRRQLAEVEQCLLAAGWAATELTDYDERYYREWSHELPPFMHPARQVEIDVHHSISPALAGSNSPIENLLHDSRPIAWQSDRSSRIEHRFKSLSAVDQLIHAAVHTFNDSDMTLRLREVMDFDLLHRHHLTTSNSTDPDAVLARAAQLGIARPVWWALHFRERWLGIPGPKAMQRAIRHPSACSVYLMEWLADRAMLPGDRQMRDPMEATAEIGLLIRQHWQRMPLYRLLPHLVRKSYRRLTGED
jgi:hypothetical protein